MRMIYVSRYLFIGLALLTLALAGCTAQRYVSAGDAAREAGRPIEAVQQYQAAIDANPSLAQNPEFLQKLRATQARAYYEEGQAFARRGQWEAALARYERAAQADPGFRPAAQALDAARYEASLARYTQAMETLEAGELDRAIELLEQAVTLDPDHLVARQALDDALAQREQRRREAQARFEQVQPLIQARQWGEAVVGLEEVRRIDPTFTVALEALEEAQQAIEQSRAAQAEGAQALSGHRLDVALERLEAALDLWPSNEPAQTLLAQAREQQAQVEALLDQARQRRQAGAWDEAMAAAAEAYTRFPTYEPAVRTLREIRQAAVQALMEQGQGQQAAQVLDQAAAAHRQAAERLGSGPGAEAVREELAAVEVARGDLARQQGQQGQALLHYLDALGHAETEMVRQRLQAIRSAIMAAHPATLALEVQGDQSEALTFAAALRERLERRAPDWLQRVPAGQGADYVAQVTVGEPRIDQSVVREASRTHTYTEHRLVPNPELPRLQAELEAERRELRELRRLRHWDGWDRHHLDGIHLRHDDDLRFRHRSGFRSPLDRHDDRFDRHDRFHRDLQDRHSRFHDRHDRLGHRSRFDDRHDHIISRPRIFLHRRHDVSSFDVSRQEREVQRLESRLRQAPATVQEPVRQHWPYVQRHVRKAATLAVRLTLRRGGEVLIDGAVIDPTVVQTDTAIDNANLAIGLGDDPLQLPSDADLIQTLEAQAAQAASTRLLHAIARAQADHLQARAKRLAEQGQAEAAREMGIAAAVLLESLDANEARRLLESLQTQ